MLYCLKLKIPVEMQKSIYRLTEDLACVDKRDASQLDSAHLWVWKALLVCVFSNAKSVKDLEK